MVGGLDGHFCLECAELCAIHNARSAGRRARVKVCRIQSVALASMVAVRWALCMGPGWQYVEPGTWGPVRWALCVGPGAHCVGSGAWGGMRDARYPLSDGRSWCAVHGARCGGCDVCAVVSGRCVMHVVCSMRGAFRQVRGARRARGVCGLCAVRARRVRGVCGVSARCVRGVCGVCAQIVRGGCARSVDGIRGLALIEVNCESIADPASPSSKAYGGTRMTITMALLPGKAFVDWALWRRPIGIYWNPRMWSFEGLWSSESDFLGDPGARRSV